MRILDLYCGAGGASRGYVDAGWEVVGVDIAEQPRYPFRFIRSDALTALKTLIAEKQLTDRNGGKWKLEDFDAIHASPPCQAHSKAQTIMKREHPELIVPTRELLQKVELPYVIENVVGAPLRSPMLLCGTMFSLPLYRHRIFETSCTLRAPTHAEHKTKQTKMGRPPVEGEFLQVVGNFSGCAEARAAMKTPWMTRNEMSEAIPPAYTEYVGSQLKLWITAEAVIRAMAPTAEAI